MNELYRRLLNDYQRGFPLTPRPFADIGDALAESESTVLDAARRLYDGGVISRIGPVFRQNRLGVSTLAAASVPDSHIERAAGHVNLYREVNHNYQREHRYNLWFVVNARDQAHLESVLASIRLQLKCRVLSLPLIKDYYIDLGFEIDFDQVDWNMPSLNRRQENFTPIRGDLVAALQGGIPITANSYRATAAQAGLTEDQVISGIGRMLKSGDMKRFGVVVRHRALGYCANAMCVWNVPDDVADQLGQRMAKLPYVRLCYRRPRRLPDWPFNLFVMIHGKDRGRVREHIRHASESIQLDRFPSAVLFSSRCFKQRGANYRFAKPGPVSREAAYG